MSEVQIFLALMSLLSALTLVGVHTHIKNRLGEKHDNGLLFAAGAIFAWLFMIFWESNKLNEHYLEVRKLISIINTGFFLSSLVYFKDGWFKVNKKLENIKYHLVAIITTLLLLIAYVFIPQKENWSYFEGWVSIIVMFLLSSSMAVTLYFREKDAPQKNTTFLYLIPIVAGFFLIFVQAFDTDFIKISHFDPFENKLFHTVARLLCLPMLVISYLLVAMTWLQKKLDEMYFFQSIQYQIAQKGESHQETNMQPLINRIAFSEDDKKIGLTMQTDSQVNFKEAEIFFGGSREKYRLLKVCAVKMKEHCFFNIKDKDLKTSDNPHKDFSDIVKLLNAGMMVKGHGRNPLPDTPIIYQRFFITGENKGEYKFPFLPENIIFLP
jgi:hypothetical protein